MKNLYYYIWSDAIISIQKNKKNTGDWKRSLMYIMTMLMSFNIATVCIWTSNICNKIGMSNPISLPEFKIFRVENFNSFLSGFISFILPCLLLNYICVFRKDRYKKFINKYPHRNARIVVIYMFATILLFLVPIYVYYILQ